MKKKPIWLKTLLFVLIYLCCFLLIPIVMIPLDETIMGNYLTVFPAILGVSAGVEFAVIAYSDTVKRTAISVLMLFVSGVVMFFVSVISEILYRVAIFMYRNALCNEFDPMWLPIAGIYSFLTITAMVFIISMLILVIMGFVRR